MIRKFLAVLLLVALVGCAGAPRHQTVKRYVAPALSGAHSCIEQCGKARRVCEEECARRAAACREALLPEAKDRHARQLAEYAAALEDYRWELARYRLDLFFGWGTPHWPGWAWYPPFPPPPPPRPPSLETVLERLASERCNRDCGCESAYDACFVGCGGEIRHEIECVANCGGEAAAGLNRR